MIKQSFFAFASHEDMLIVFKPGIPFKSFHVALGLLPLFLRLGIRLVFVSLFFGANDFVLGILGTQDSK